MNERYIKGIELVRKLNPDAAKNVIEEFSDVAPDMSKFIFEFAMADVYARDILDVKTRELLTIAALTTLGNGERQLFQHIEGALVAGCKKEEITEAILQMVIFAGFPASMNALLVAKRVFEKHVKT